jgi:hypothetical protein
MSHFAIGYHRSHSGVVSGVTKCSGGSFWGFLAILASQYPDLAFCRSRLWAESLGDYHGKLLMLVCSDLQ